MSHRSYVFVSASKVDLVLARVDPSATLVRTADCPEPERRTRLERVVRHLEQRGEIGEIGGPRRFFRGRLPMRWGPFPDEGSRTLVLFGGAAGPTVLGLGGWVRHLVDGGHDGWSWLPPVLGGLAAELEDELVVEAAEYAGVLEPDDTTALATVHRSVMGLGGPEREVEFVAERLLHGLHDGTPVILGSPVFVSVV